VTAFFAAVFLGARGGDEQRSTAPTPNPLQGKVTTMYDEGYPLGANGSAEEADIVAEVTIDATEPYRFNTPDGSLPSMLGSMGVEWLYRPARLLVHRGLAGPDSAPGFWVPLWGGTRDGFTFKRSPDHLMRDGQFGLVFLREVPLGMRSEPFFAHLETLGAAQGTVEPVYQVVNWYRYDGDIAISPADESELSVDGLLALVEAALAARSGSQ
jgi:hypothetical protein